MLEATPQSNPSIAERSRPSRVPYGAILGGVVLLAMAWFIPVLPANDEQVRVVFALGGGQVTTADGQTTPLTDSVSLLPGDRLDIPAGARATLVTADGHQLVLAESSSVQVSKGRRSLLGGTVRNTIAITRGEARLSGKGRAFSSMSVGLPNGTAGVRGTNFDVVISGETAALSLHEGSVLIDDLAVGPVDLSPGDGIVVTEKGVEVVPVPVAPEVTPIPADQSVIHTSGVLFRWDGGPVRFRVEIATDPNFLEVRKLIDTTGDRIAIPLLELDTAAYVRVYRMTDVGLRGAPSKALTVQMAHRWAKGIALRDEGKLEEGLALLEAERTRFADNALLLRDIGWTYYLMSRHDEARQVYERGRQLSPNYRDLLVELGRVYFWLNDTTQAEQTYQAVLKDHPDDAIALWGLGDLYRTVGRRAEALDLVRRALKSDPSHPYARETLKQLQGGG